MDSHDEEPGVFDAPESAVGTPGVSNREKTKQSGLTAALRRARVENAERTDVLTDLRGAELTRLEILREHLQPVFEEIPADCDIFDPGVAPGERPRLFIDMVAFVEMGRDRRSYRFVQDSRAGRSVISESERIETTVRAITDYIARRLIEREKALATIAAPPNVPTPVAIQVRSGATPPVAPPRPRPAALRVFARGFLFIVEIIGSAVLFGALAAAAIWAWQAYIRHG